MRDQRRRGENGNALDQAVESAIQSFVRDLPPEEQVPAIRDLRLRLGALLAEAPAPDHRLIEDMVNRARLASAFRVEHSSTDK